MRKLSFAPRRALPTTTPQLVSTTQPAANLNPSTLAAPGISKTLFRNSSSSAPQPNRYTRKVLVNGQEHTITILSYQYNAVSGAQVLLSRTVSGLNLDHRARTLSSCKTFRPHVFLLSSEATLNAQYLGALIESGITTYHIQGNSVVIPSPITTTWRCPQPWTTSENGTATPGDIDIAPALPDDGISPDDSKSVVNEPCTQTPSTSRPSRPSPVISGRPVAALPVMQAAPSSTYLSHPTVTHASVGGLVPDPNLYIYDPLPDGLCGYHVLDVILGTRHSTEQITQVLDSSPLLSNLCPKDADGQRPFATLEQVLYICSAFGYKGLTTYSSAPFSPNMNPVVHGDLKNAIVIFLSDAGDATSVGHFTFGFHVAAFRTIQPTPGLCYSEPALIPRMPDIIEKPIAPFVMDPFGGNILGLSGAGPAYKGTIDFTLEQGIKIFGASHNNDSYTGSGQAGAITLAARNLGAETAYSAAYTKAPPGSLFLTPFGSISSKFGSADATSFYPPPAPSPVDALIPCIPAVGTGIWNWKINGIWTVVSWLQANPGYFTMSVDQGVVNDINTAYSDMSTTVNISLPDTSIPPPVLPSSSASIISSLSLGSAPVNNHMNALPATSDPFADEEPEPEDEDLGGMTFHVKFDADAAPPPEGVLQQLPSPPSVKPIPPPSSTTSSYVTCLGTRSVNAESSIITPPVPEHVLSPIASSAGSISTLDDLVKANNPDRVDGIAAAVLTSAASHAATSIISKTIDHVVPAKIYVTWDNSHANFTVVPKSSPLPKVKTTSHFLFRAMNGDMKAKETLCTAIWKKV